MAERKDKDYLKQQLYFDPVDKKQMECYEFLKLCNRKTTKYLSVIIHGFIKTNNIVLSDMTPELLGDYMKLVIQNEKYNGSLPFSGFDAGIKIELDEKDEEEKKENTMSASDMEEIKSAFAGF